MKDSPGLKEKAHNVLAAVVGLHTVLVEVRHIVGVDFAAAGHKVAAGDMGCLKDLQKAAGVGVNGSFDFAAGVGDNFGTAVGADNVGIVDFVAGDRNYAEVADLAEDIGHTAAAVVDSPLGKYWC